MTQCKVPNYLTGQRGKNWSVSLRRAHAAGAVIVVEETGVPVVWDKPKLGSSFRNWIDDKGNRYDSRDCIPVF